MNISEKIRFLFKNNKRRIIIAIIVVVSILVSWLSFSYFRSERISTQPQIKPDFVLIKPGSYDLNIISNTEYSKLEVKEKEDALSFLLYGNNYESASFTLSKQLDLRVDFDGCFYTNMQTKEMGLDMFNTRGTDSQASNYLGYTQQCPNKSPVSVMVRSFELPTTINSDYIIHAYSAEVYNAKLVRVKSFYLNLIFNARTGQHVETLFSGYNYEKNLSLGVRFENSDK